jgi:hypothetical protein
VIAHPALGHGAEGQAQQRGEELSQVSVRETQGQEAAHHQGTEQRLAPGRRSVEPWFRENSACRTEMSER